MDQESSEASPLIPAMGRSLLDLDRPPATPWFQQHLLPPSRIVITPQFVFDGPDGMVSSSVTVTDYDTGDLIALETWPALRLPAGLPVALAWIEERVQHYSLFTSPF